MTERNRFYENSQGETTVDTNETIVGEYPVRDFERAMIEVVNKNGGAALTNFKIYARGNHDGVYQCIFKDAGDYTSPAGILLGAGDSAGASLDFTTMAANKRGWLILEVRGFHSIKLTATCGTSTTVSSRIGAQ